MGRGKKKERGEEGRGGERGALGFKRQSFSTHSAFLAREQPRAIKILDQDLVPSPEVDVGAKFWAPALRILKKAPQEAALRTTHPR